MPFLPLSSLPTMASNETSIPSTISIPPPGTNFIAVIQPSVTYLMIGTTSGTILVSMLLALFFFSTRSMRHQPIFLANIIAICFGLTLSLFNGYVEIRALLSPADPIHAATFVAYAVINSIGPILVDSILLIRLFAVFPFTSTPRLRWIGIVSFPILMKIARIINNAVFCNKEQRLVPHISPQKALNSWPTL
ncbi:hypothetical protein A0H81_12149 [Grifola frondosa]|uniref:Uncharacterized protein n=1 Tax=Grifola frondosa TaxID=5627 RepID=A0A1C7LV47_GRIFR|nr:hypothetical protein A0H81_12149 [Grifola frondosa]